MMFSAGMGIGLVFMGSRAFESPFAISTPNAEIGSADAHRCFSVYFFHWGFHAWAVYALVGLSLAYFLAFVNGRNISSQSSLSLFFGKYADGPIATIIDTITIIATVIGVATTLALVPHKSMVVSPMSLVFLIIVLCKSSLSSLRQFFSYFCLIRFRKGVKILSNTNLILAIVLLAES